MTRSLRALGWLGLVIGCTCWPSAWGQDSAHEAQAAAAIRATARAFVDAFDRGDAKQLAAHWAANGEYIDESGNVYSGREAIAQGYSEFFADRPGAKMHLTVTSVRLINESTAIEDGYATIEPYPAGAPGTGRYTAVHVLSDGKWLIASLRDLHEPVPTTYHHLADLEWMIGGWVAEENGGRLESTCRWIANKSFVLREYHATRSNGDRKSGVQVIGLNPNNGSLQSWTFDSDGGHAVGTWTAIAEGWSIQAEGVLGDGTRTTATNVLRRLDDQAYVWKSERRSANGAALADSDEIVLRRQPSAK